MLLKVTLYRDGAKISLVREVVAEFDDAEKIGVLVGRQVRDWLRARPFRASGTRVRFDVHAWWTTASSSTSGSAFVPVEDQPPKPRRKRRRK